MEKLKTKGILFLVLVLLVLERMSLTTFAKEVPDLNKSGSISVTIKNRDSVISGGSLTLYQVAEVQEDDGDYNFVFTSEFVSCQLSLENIQWEQLAKDLANYVESADITGIKKSIDSKGNVIFSNLQLGLYLIIQEDAAPGYYAVNPFLISVPMESEEKWIYDIDATPKVELEKEQNKDPSSPNSSDESVLPQTGQLNWPVPVLVASGLILFAFGWFLCFARRKNRYEE